MVAHIGPALRAARIQQKLSLRSMAADIGVSASLLSQVETGKTQPSVGTFYAIVTRLGISVDELFGFDPDAVRRSDSGQHAPAAATAAAGSRNRRKGALDSADTAVGSAPGELLTKPAPVVQRANEHPILEMESGVVWELLALGDRSVVDALLVTYRPGASSSISGRMMQHNGVEYAYFLQGELTLKLEFDTYVLRPGDSLCFDSSRPHLYVNNGEEDARGIWFVLGRKGQPVSQHAAELLAEAGFGNTGA